MRSFIKGLMYAGLGLIVLIPAALLLIAVGIPLIAVGAVIAGLMGLVVLAIGLPFLILGAVILGLVGALFAVFAAIVGVGLLALKLTLMVVVAFLGLRWLGRAMFGGRRARHPEALNEPARDPLEVEAERELDQELGIRS